VTIIIALAYFVFGKQILLWASVLLLLLNINVAQAQQDFGIRYADGIPLTSVLLNLGIVLALFAFIIRFFKTTRKKAIGGIGVLVMSLAIVAYTTPVQINSSVGGVVWTDSMWMPIEQYCSNSCLTMDESTIASYPKLKISFEAADKLGNNRCCAGTMVNYYEELAMYPILASATKEGDYWIIGYGGDYYRISLYHLDTATHTYAGTFFPEEVIFWDIITAFAFYAIILPAMRTKDKDRIRNISWFYELLDWLARRRISIAIITGVSLFAPFIFFYALLHHTWHSSSASNLFSILWALVVYITAVSIARFLNRRLGKEKIRNADKPRSIV
jgi:hypothetical protein